MILIDDAKYACIECIRGHRSSLCRHQTRPLLQVRSKGRPNVRLNCNPNHRVAVFAKELNENNPDKYAGEIEKCSNKETAVIILKATHKKIIDFRNGHIVGPYDETVEKTQTPYINDESFVYSSSCCPNGASKVKKGCQCNGNKSKKIDKLKILQSYLAKKMKPRNWEFVDATKEVKIEDDTSLDSLNGGKKQDYNCEAQVFDVMKVPSCSIPGTCLCSDGCSCEGCVIHGNTSTNQVLRQVPVIETPYQTKNADSFYDSNSSESEPVSTFNSMYASTFPLVVDSNIKQEPKWNVSTSNMVATLQEGAGPSPFEPILSLQFQDRENHRIPHISEQIESMIENSCKCEDDCACSNCETHGIINGVRLDEFFCGAPSTDYRSLIDLLEKDNIFLEYRS